MCLRAPLISCKWLVSDVVQDQRKIRSARTLFKFTTFAYSRARQIAGSACVGSQGRIAAGRRRTKEEFCHWMLGFRATCMMQGYITHPVQPCQSLSAECRSAADSHSPTISFDAKAPAWPARSAGCHSEAYAALSFYFDRVFCISRLVHEDLQARDIQNVTSPDRSSGSKASRSCDVGSATAAGHRHGGDAA